MNLASLSALGGSRRPTSETVGNVGGVAGGGGTGGRDQVVGALERVGTGVVQSGSTVEAGDGGPVSHVDEGSKTISTRVGGSDGWMRKGC